MIRRVILPAVLTGIPYGFGLGAIFALANDWIITAILCLFGVFGSVLLSDLLSPPNYDE